MIHHYTNLSTLALILKHKTIRFNRLDRVDDVSESSAYGRYDLSKYLFVSSWTSADDESIPQWEQYADKMTGVRISIPRSPFKFRKVNPFESDGFLDSVGLGVPAPLPWDRMITDDYLLIPTFNDPKHFEHEVEYVDDPAALYEGMVTENIRENGGIEVLFNRTHMMGRYKGKPWEHQKEVRYVLFAMPGVPMTEKGLGDEEYHKRLLPHMIKCIRERRGPSTTYIDLDLDPATLGKMVVTLGPLAAAGEEALAEAVIKTHAPSVTLSESVLAGTIRRPLR